MKINFGERVIRCRHKGREARVLRKAGIPFETRDDGARLVINHCIDFWPGTGLWIPRGTKARHRGVHSLVRFYKVTNAQRSAP